MWDVIAFIPDHCLSIYLVVSGECFHFCRILHKNSCKQRVWTLIRHRVLGLQCLHNSFPKWGPVDNG